MLTLVCWPRRALGTKGSRRGVGAGDPVDTQLKQAHPKELGGEQVVGAAGPVLARAICKPPGAL
jgi:hypothetical protein